MPDQRGERRGPGGYRTSVLGRVDWACWLAAVGFLFLTVVSVLVQFAILGVITAILAVGIVAFDSWINRPKGFRDRRADQNRQTGAGRNSAVSRARPSAQNFRRPTTVGQPRRQPPPPARQSNGQPPRQPQRQPPGQQRQQPPRQPPPLGQPPLGQPPLGQPPLGQGQPPQGQPPRPPFRPSPPDPGRARR